EPEGDDGSPQERGDADGLEERREGVGRPHPPAEHALEQTADDERGEKHRREGDRRPDEMPHGVHAIVDRAHESARSLLRLGRPRGRRHRDRRGHGRPLLARRLPQAHRGLDALEPERHLAGRADQLDRDGGRLVRVGGALRPDRRPRGRRRGRLHPGPGPGAVEPGRDARPVLRDLRRPRRIRRGRVLRAAQFWAMALTHFACCAAHSGPIFHMVTHAIDQGVAAMVAATVFGVSGLASIAGRIGCGLLADRFGAKPTLVAGLTLQAAMVFAYLFTREAGSFYAAAVVFGVAYGGVMPLYALVTREYFGEKMMGTAYGAVFLI